jgi:hypothetical protein
VKAVSDILPVARQAVGCVSFEIVPDLLNWIEFWGIPGKGLDMQARVVLPQLGNIGSFVDAPLVPEEDNVPTEMM